MKVENLLRLLPRHYDKHTRCTTQHGKAKQAEQLVVAGLQLAARVWTDVAAAAVRCWHLLFAVAADAVPPRQREDAAVSYAHPSVAKGYLVHS